MFGSICPCGIEGFAWLDKWEVFVLSNSACVYERAGQRVDFGQNRLVFGRMEPSCFALAH